MRASFIRVVLIAIVGLGTRYAAAQTPDQVVHWSASLKPETVSAGSEAVATVSATIVSGWHVYSITQPPGGPRAATVRVPDGQDFKASGNVTGSKPETAYDQNFNMNTEFYEKSASLRLPIAVSQQAAASATKVKVDVRFQTCNNRLCLPPTTAHLEAPVTVKR